MAGRIRSIKPEILEDEEAASLTSDAWRLWVSMWTLADDYGNLRATPAMLKAHVFWAYPIPPSITIDEILRELVSKNRIVLYVVTGSQYAHVRNWEKHQRISNAGDPRVPGPEDFSANRREPPRTAARPTINDPDLDQRSTIPITTNDQHADAHVGLPVGWLEDMYRRYPRKGDRGKGATALEALAAGDLTRFAAAVSAYAQKVADEETPPRYVTTWPVFCAEKWRDYADGDTSPKRKRNGEVRAPVDKTRKERL